MEAQHVLVFSITLTFLLRTWVFAAYCPSTDTSSVVQVCTSGSITGSYLSIDTRNVSSSATWCSCSVSLGGNSVRYIEYSGPGTPLGLCGIEFRFTTILFSCQSTNLPRQTVTGFTYSQTNNPVNTACLSMRIDGNASITCYESGITLKPTQIQSSTTTATTRTTTTTPTTTTIRTTTTRTTTITPTTTTADIDMMTTNIQTQRETTELGKRSNQDDIGDTVGGILGGLVGIVLLAVLITICVVKRKHLNKRSHDTPSQSIDVTSNFSDDYVMKTNPAYENAFNMETDTESDNDTTSMKINPAYEDCVVMETIPDSDLENTMTTNRVYENLVI